MKVVHSRLLHFLLAFALALGLGLAFQAASQQQSPSARIEAAVDTFLGLQVAAQEIQADLAKHGFGKRIGPVRSTSQWFKWLAGSQI